VSVHQDDSGAIILEGNCSVEDAESLLCLLQTTPAATVDWTRCDRLHTAVLQVIIALAPALAGPCGDPWVDQWVTPKIL
jgi:hypothetical protein